MENVFKENSHIIIRELTLWKIQSLAKYILEKYSKCNALKTFKMIFLLCVAVNLNTKTDEENVL